MADRDLQHGTAGPRTQPLAVDHAHAAQLARDAVRDELTQRVVRREQAHAVQVGLGFDRELAPLQLAQLVFAHAVAPELQLPAMLVHRRVAGLRAALEQQLLSPSAREAGDCARPGSRGRRWLGRERAHAGHRSAERLPVVVGGRRLFRRHAGGLRFRGGQGFQYSCAAFVANPAAAGAQITIRSHAT